MSLRPHHERLLFNTLSLVVLLYAILRARLIPISIDEVSTVVNHATRSVSDIITYRADATPNNHVLHTLLVNFFTWLLGHHHVVVRIPALLGGVLYVWAATKIARMGSLFWMRLLTWLLLLGNPFVVEFFALARGYSLGAGGMLAAIYFALRYHQTKHGRELGLALFWGIMAVESNFTLLNFFAPFVVVLLMEARSAVKKQWLLHSVFILCAIAVLAALCYTPITAMRATNQFVFWGNNGFYKETLLELVRTATRNTDLLGPDTRYIVAWSVITISVAGWITALVRWWKNKFQFDLTILVSGIFAGTFLVNMLQYYLFATPFLNARTALFYYPLFALQLGAVILWIWEKWRYAALVVVMPVVLFLGANFNRCANLSNAYEWWFDAGTFTTIDFLQKTHKDENQTAPFTLDTNWPNFNSFMYHLQWSTPHYEEVIQLGKWHPGRVYPQDTEFYYTDSDDEVRQLDSTYAVVMVIPDTGLRLLRKRKSE